VGPRGEPIATSSVCWSSGNIPWVANFINFRKMSFGIGSESFVLSEKIYSAIMSMVSSSGTLVNKETTSTKYED